ncbi:MAG: hypothetical protein ACYS0D_13530 [Planctomycetota bacterium]|jgi:hypothetical protein
MTNKEAFVSGIRIFCKSAGFDAEDAAQLEHVLFMAPEQAEPIIKAASVTVRSVEYVRAGEKLAAVNIQDVIAQLQSQVTSPHELQAIRDWASKQEQAAQLQQAQQAGATAGDAMKGVAGAAVTGGGKAREYFKQTATGETAPPAATEAEGAAATPEEDPAAKAEAQFRESYESSPYKDQMPFNVYASLKGQYDQAKGFGGEVVPEDVYIGGQWAATKSKIQRRASRRTMRGFGLDMAPGQLAAMSDADIAARTDDPMVQASFRNARDLAKRRQRLQGGVGARMGTGLGTGQPAEAAAEATAPPEPAAPPTSTAPEPVTSPTPSNVPQTSVSPNGNGAVAGTPPTSTAPTPPPAQPAQPTDMDIANKFSTSDWQKQKLGGGSVEVGLPSGGKLTSGLD